MTQGGGRELDHVVMPFGSLGEARRIFEGLGFVVAPDAAHPFGTGNACLFFGDGSYIEPLAVLDRDAAETAAAEGNAFLRHDLGYRLRHGLPALTGLALKSADAIVDDERFREAGIGTGAILEFARPLQGPDGGEIDLRFRLAFALDRQAPTVLVFACERRFDVVLDRGALADHPNGVRGISRLVFAAEEPEKIRPFFETVLSTRDAVANSFGLSLAFGGRTLEVLAPDGIAARYGVADEGIDGIRFLGLVLATDRPGEIPGLARSSGMISHELLGRHIVPLGGDGIFLGFEQAL